MDYFAHMKGKLYSHIQSKYSFSDCQMVFLSHGIDIIVNDSINMLFLLFIAFISRDLFQGIVYLLSFTSMRRHSGGWHASTRLLCFLSYQLVFVFLLVCSNFITDFRIIILMFLGSISYIIKNAPVQHIYNPLTEQEVINNRNKLARNLVLICLAFSAFSLYESHYAFTICYASSWNALCMSLLKHSNMWRKT